MADTAPLPCANNNQNRKGIYVLSFIIKVATLAIVTGFVLAAYGDNPTAMALWDIAKALFMDVKAAFWAAGESIFNLLFR